MENVVCQQCDLEQNSKFNFCIGCGTKLKCSSCNAQVVKNAKYCNSCGTLLESENELNASNTIKFKETKDERSCEVAFTNEATKEVSNVLMSMLGNRTVKLNGSYELNTSEKIDVTEQNENDADVLDITDRKVEIIDNKQEVNVQKDYYHINDLELKINGIIEKDWILLYAFYFSDFGLKHFTKDSVVEHYKEKRGTKNRIKSFSREWSKAFTDYFTTLNSEKLLLNDEGRKQADNILKGITVAKKGNNTTNKRKTQTSKPTKLTETKKTARSKHIKIDEFEAITDKVNLTDFFKDTNPSNNSENILTIAYFIQKKLNRPFFTDGNIDFAYKFLRLERLNYLRQTITNVKNKELWFENGEEDKSWNLTRKGELEFEKLNNDSNH